MIIPSIDLMDGRAVQLRRGREKILDGGDPFERLDEFAVTGEVAVVDLDATLGRGSNADIIRDMVRRAPCRVGGGIRDIETAYQWLDEGAVRIVVGTAASREFCGSLPRDRVIAAVDAERGRVVDHGWQRETGESVVQRIKELAPVVGGFLFTQVEHEGGLAGFDSEILGAARSAAGPARITAAGGVSTVQDIRHLHKQGIDAQVGMALYTGRFTLGAAFAATLERPVESRYWPTVVCDENGTTLGVVWSTQESLAAAIDARQGIYWSRTRDELWVKGSTSGAVQELLRVHLDCDDDALRFTVRQHPPGFCHTGRRSCWPLDFDVGSLERVIDQRQRQADPTSGTHKLFADEDLLQAKLREEADELARARTPQEVTREAADLLYFAVVAMRRGQVTLADVVAELARRHRRVRRRPMRPKPETGST